MKNLVKVAGIAVIGASLLLLISCSGIENPTGVPASPAVEQSTAQHSVYLISLPERSSLERIQPAVGFFTVQTGGQIHTEYSYRVRGGKSVTGDVSLHVDPKAVDHDTFAFMLVNDGKLAIDFYPEGIQFGRAAHLNAHFTGLDFSYVPAGAVVQLYYDNDGAWELVPAESVTINAATGELVCVNGLISHFSRYGFGF